MNIEIISGLSGSGKTVALQALEDLGYYCIDNLPVVLLPGFVRELVEREDTAAQAAVSIDSRNRAFLEAVPATLQQLDELGIAYRIVFIEANEETLVRRYSTTRRRHPLTDGKTPLLEAIRQEKELLAPLSDAARRHIDTSTLTPHELRALMRDSAAGATAAGPTLLFESFGFKHGTPRHADFVFDVRCLPNPYWDRSLRPHTGLDEPVKNFLGDREPVERMFGHLREFIAAWLPDFQRENRSYITVAIGCTGGQHRSVYLAQRLAVHFRERQGQVQVRHRDMEAAAG